ncbi:hypothetical protein GGI09_001270 [Coemansia sp. S100]|nr:hypothetical protein GGI09_001270 [Coemansia sp. S100]
MASTKNKATGTSANAGGKSNGAGSLEVVTSRSGTHTSDGSGSSRLHLRDGSHPVTRTPSAVEFPGAFTTHPRRLDKTQQDSVDRISIVPHVMKNRVTEAVGGGLANVVGGVYNIVSYVNPLGSARDSKAPTPAKSDDDSSSSNARLSPIGGTELAAQSDLPQTPDSLLAGPMVLQVPSAGTSVAADLDEHCLADANADNPESNRPPTPTKTMFSRMLRFPAGGDGDSSAAGGIDNGAGGGDGQAGGARGDPVSRNVAQRTGLQFRPGAEERRRYMRRMSKAPQLNAPVTDAAGVRRRSASADVAEVSSSGSSSEATDDEDGGEAVDAAEGYQAAAASQRKDSKTHAVDAWRFIAPRTKRVKRRVLWRVFLAQEISPAIYDEASSASPAGKQAAGSVRRGINAGPAKGPGSAVWAMEFSVCGRYLAAGGQDGVVRIWRIRAYAREQANAATSTLAAAALPPTMHQQQQQPLSAGSDNAPFTNSAPIAKGGAGGSKHTRSFSVGQPALAHMSDQPAAASSGDVSQNLSQTQSLHPMHAYELLEPVPFRSYVGHSADVLSLSWSKNGFLLSASADRTVRLWHPHRPECLCTFRHRDIVTSVAFSPRDDRLFISGSLDCRLRLWDIPARGVRHWTKLPDAQMVTAVAFTSPRADHIVAGTYRGMCVFYSTDGLAVQGRMHARSSRGRNAHGSKITGFASACASPTLPDRLLVSSNDSRLRMFLPAARQLERKYKGHANASSQSYARLSSDARYIISGSEDHNVYVWPVAQDNAATVATHPNADRVQRPAPARGGSERNPLLQALFGRGSRGSNAAAAPVATAPVATNDAEEWESLDGKVEEKSIYEYFPAHDAAVSQALFAPAATLQYLADHDDPILSRPKLRRSGPAGDVENQLPPTAHGTFAEPVSDIGDVSADTTVEDMTAIIVSADTSGNIRVFRKDINVPAKAKRSNLSAIPSCSKSSTALSMGRASAISSINQGSTSDLVSYSMSSAPSSLPTTTASARRNTLDLQSRPQSSAARSLQRSSAANVGASPASPMPPVPQRPATQRLMQAQLPISSSNNQRPPPITTSQSFWGRLSRRMTHARNTSVSAPVIHPPVPSDDGDACQFCGHTRMIQFAVATASADPASPHTPPSLSVCENCRRVKDLPAT